MLLVVVKCNRDRSFAKRYATTEAAFNHLLGFWQRM